MIEEKPVIKIIDNVIDNIDIEKLIFEIENNLSKMMLLSRNYLFNDEIRGHSLSHARNVSPVIDRITNNILNSLETFSDLDSMISYELGIGINLTNMPIYVEKATNRLHIDDAGRQVRLPIRGESEFSKLRLINGSAYIVDNITGYSFSASHDCIHLVFNYIEKEKNALKWQLWKRKYD